MTTAASKPEECEMSRHKVSLTSETTPTNRPTEVEQPHRAEVCLICFVYRPNGSTILEASLQPPFSDGDTRSSVPCTGLREL